MSTSYYSQCVSQPLVLSDSEILRLHGTATELRKRSRKYQNRHVFFFYVQ